MLPVTGLPPQVTIQSTPALVLSPDGIMLSFSVEATTSVLTFAVAPLESITEIDGIAGEIPGQMRGDDGSIRRLFDRDRLGMEAVLAPRLLGPAADRPAAPKFTSFIAHEGVFGKTGGDPVGIIGIGRGEVLGEGAWQLDDHGAAPLRLVR